MFATAGRPEPDPPLPPVGPFVAIAVGKTNEGESLPANPVTTSLVSRFLPRTCDYIPTKRANRTEFREAGAAIGKVLH